MCRWKTFAFGASCALGFLSFASEASAFTASFRWCSGSPAFTLNAVPKGTEKLRFDMTDLNKPSFNHGGGTVAFSGQRSIACGAFSGGFVGPSPPPPEVQTYEFEIRAIGADGSTLGTAKARRKFPE